MGGPALFVLPFVHETKCSLSALTVLRQGLGACWPPSGRFRSRGGRLYGHRPAGCVWSRLVRRRAAVCHGLPRANAAVLAAGFPEIYVIDASSQGDVANSRHSWQ